MGIHHVGYNYPDSTASIITTDSTPTSPKPGVAHYVGETTPGSAQVGDLWTSSTGIRRWTGTAWDIYVGASGGGVSVFKSGSYTFTGSSVTIPFTSAFSSTPSVVATISNGTTAYVMPLVYNVTTSNFAIQIYSVENGNAVTGTWTVEWVATAATTGTPANSSTTANIVTGVTNGSSVVPVLFGYTYASAPSVVVTPRDSSPNSIVGLYEPRYSVKDITTTGFNLYVTYDESGLVPVGAGKNVKFNWIANAPTFSSPSGATTAGTITAASSSGLIPVVFNYTYPAKPSVNAFWTNGVVGNDSNFRIESITTTGFNIRVYQNDGGAGGTVTGTFSWLATPYL